MPAPVLTAIDGQWTVAGDPENLVDAGAAGGDFLFLVAGGDIGGVTACTTSTTAGTTGSWTEIVESFPGAGDCWMHTAWAAVTAGGSVTASTDPNPTPASAWGNAMVRARGSLGIGNSANATTGGAAQTISLTVSKDHSAVLFMSLDFSAGSVGTGWTPSGATLLHRELVTGAYTVHVAYWSDEAAGTRSYGSTGAGGNDFVLFAVEILGSPDAGVQPYIGGKAWRRRHRHRQWLPISPASAVDSRAQTGTCSFGEAGSATQSKTSVQTATGTAALAATATDKKITAQAGTVTAATAALATEKKVTPEQGTATAAAAGTGTDKKVGVERGTATAAAIGTAAEAKVAKELGTATAAFASTKEGAAGARAQTGLCSLGAAGTATGKKVASSHTGTSAAAHAPRATLTKRATSIGRGCFAAAGTSLAVHKAPQQGVTSAGFWLTGDAFVATEAEAHHAVGVAPTAGPAASSTTTAGHATASVAQAAGASGGAATAAHATSSATTASGG